MSIPFRTTHLVEFADTDMAGIVHFSSYFRYMESAEHAFLRSRGLSVMTSWDGQAITFPRVSASCEFLSPARFEDVLDVSVVIAKMGRSSIAYEIGFELHGKPCAHGKITTVCCKLLEGHRLESLAIPDELRRKLLTE